MIRKKGLFFIGFASFLLGLCVIFAGCPGLKPDPVPVAEDFTVSHALLESAWQFIESKPNDVQKIFYLMYNVGLTISEISNELSMHESNVKNKLYRTLKELRNLLK